MKLCERCFKPERVNLIQEGFCKCPKEETTSITVTSTQKGFNKTNTVLKYWSISDQVYRDGEKNSDPTENMVPIATIKRLHDYCEVWRCIDTDTIIIAFRGSDDFKDWWSNFKLNSLKEHKDVADKFEMFKAEIADVVKRFPAHKFGVTGHSRGGLFATYCADYLASVLKVPCSCITFGCPKPGNRAYRDFYNKLPIDHTNFIVGRGWLGDVVASLPPRVFGFRRVGKTERLKRPHFWSLKVQNHFRKNIYKALKKRFKK